jgi:Icc-related predicted phosphoesterase
MVLTRIQASDFQDAGVKGNLSKLETIALFSATSKPRAVDIVGDVFDAHILQEVIAASPKTNVSALQKIKPELGKTLGEYRALNEMLSKKYGENLNSNRLTSEELQAAKGLEEEIQKSGLLEAQAQDFVEAIAGYYQGCAKILGGIKVPLYFVRGNNDTCFMQDIVKGTYPELVGRLVEDGPFRIIGMNNTNYPQEDILTQRRMGTMHVPPDWQDAYSKYSINKTGKKANVIMMHDPPNGFREGHDERDGEGITKLISEHIPDNGFVLVECGHYHKAKLETVKSKDGKRGYVIARSSPNIFFEHSFDDNGNYVSTHIYQYQN